MGISERKQGWQSIINATEANLNLWPDSGEVIMDVNVRIHDCDNPDCLAHEILKYASRSYSALAQPGEVSHLASFMAACERYEILTKEKVGPLITFDSYDHAIKELLNHLAQKGYDRCTTSDMLFLIMLLNTAGKSLVEYRIEFAAKANGAGLD